MNRIIILFATALFSIALASPTISPERNNLKLLETSPMLFEFHRLTTSAANQEFHYPQRDSAWRANATGRENFFLDDLQSPTELIQNDNVQSKWAWMAGLQLARNFDFRAHLFEVGTLAEYARVEPYVYTHFKSNSAQIAHLEVPLGNQGGPNSQTIDWLLYSRVDKQFTLEWTFFDDKKVYTRMGFKW